MTFRGMSKTESLLLAVVVAVLFTMAVPRYYNVKEQSDITKREFSETVVKSALMIALADTNSFPSVVTLASYVQGDNVVAQNVGVELAVKGDTYTVSTFTDSKCTSPTNLTSDRVQCVGYATD